MDIKILITLISPIVTVIIAIGSFYYIKFQTEQNKQDIKLLKSESNKIKTHSSEDLSRIYDKIDTGYERVIDKLDDVKKNFVSRDTCNELREAFMHRIK